MELSAERESPSAEVEGIIPAVRRAKYGICMPAIIWKKIVYAIRRISADYNLTVKAQQEPDRKKQVLTII